MSPGAGIRGRQNRRVVINYSVRQREIAICMQTFKFPDWPDIEDTVYNRHLHILLNTHSQQ